MRKYGKRKRISH